MFHEINHSHKTPNPFIAKPMWNVDNPNKKIKQIFKNFLEKSLNLCF